MKNKTPPDVNPKPSPQEDLHQTTHEAVDRPSPQREPIKMDLSINFANSLDFLANLDLGVMDLFTMASVLKTLREKQTEIETLKKQNDFLSELVKDKSSSELWALFSELFIENRELKARIRDLEE
jgi:hypothetical protein